MTSHTLAFAPLIPWPLLAGLALLAVLFLAQPAWRGLTRASEIETYAIAASEFDAKLEAQNARYKVGDDDGVMVLPKEQAVELANRAMDVLEKENRLRGEIDSGKTLAEVAYLQKWEKR